MIRRLLVLTAVLVAALAATASAATYEVGVGVRSINPDADGTWNGEPVYLGGYGLSGGTPVMEGRPAKGIIGDGVSVRAITIGDGTHTVALADAELQGWFAATRDGALGIADVRKEVERRTDGAIKATDVVVQSDHSHSGPDLIGPWGGAPEGYRQYVVDQTVDAILAAWGSRRSGTLRYGEADASDLLHNQFDYDPANKDLDTQLRVLQARDSAGTPFATLVNLAAHATVLGGQPYASGDWPAALNAKLDAGGYGKGVTIVGTVGRSQPNRDAPCGQYPSESREESQCKIDGYADRVLAVTDQAIAASQELDGPAKVDSSSYLIQDPATNPLLIAMLIGGSKAVGMPLNRSLTPPWSTGNVVGTSTSSVRIGDVLLSAAPGEMYPRSRRRSASSARACAAS